MSDFRTRTLAVGFADLEGWAALTDEMGDAPAAEILQAAFDAAGEILTGHGCELRKYVGDCILFTGDDPSATVAAARDLAGGAVPVPDRDPLRFTVSVAVGDVVEGEIGHPSLRRTDVLGATVNRAALGLADAREAPDRLALDGGAREAGK